MVIREVLDFMVTRIDVNFNCFNFYELFIYLFFLTIYSLNNYGLY